MNLIIWYDEHNWTPLTSQGLNQSLTKGTYKTMGVSFSQVIDLVYHQTHTLIVMDSKELDRAITHIVDSIIQNPDWANSFNDKMIRESKRLLRNTKNNAVKARIATNLELIKFNEEFINGVEAQFNYGLISVLAESNEGQLSRSYAKIFSQKNIPPPELADLMAASEPSAHLLSTLEMCKLALDNLNSEDKKKVLNFKKYFEKWKWLPYAFVGPSWTMEECRSNFRKYNSKSKNELESKINNLNNFKKVEKHRKNLMQKYKFNNYEKKLTRTISRFASTKYLRKENLTHAHFYYHNILEEIAKRLNLSISETRMLTKKEISLALTKCILPDMNQRAKLAAYIYTKCGVEVKTGLEAKEIEEKLNSVGNTIEQSELQGQCASRGYGKGVVSIVNTKEDIAKMKKGNILISYATYPELVPAMKLAAAIVTDRGGVTCHAAIVSRELGVPCVIGTKIATKVFKDGDLVEVDANKGTVRILKKNGK